MSLSGGRREGQLCKFTTHIAFASKRSPCSPPLGHRVHGVNGYLDCLILWLLKKINEVFQQINDDCLVLWNMAASDDPR